MPVGHAKTHWQQYCAGAAAAGRRADRGDWRLARSILVTETDEEAREYLADEKCSVGWYYTYLRDNLAPYKLLKIMKPSEALPHQAGTLRNVLPWLLRGGAVDRVRVVGVLCTCCSIAMTTPSRLLGDRHPNSLEGAPPDRRCLDVAAGSPP